MGHQGGHQWPEGQAGRVLRRALAPGERVLGWQEGRGGATLVATDQRAIILNRRRWLSWLGWLGGVSAIRSRAWPYSQISRVALHTTTRRNGKRAGWVEITLADDATGARVDFSGGDNWFRPLVALLCRQVALAQHAAAAEAGE